MTFSKYNAAISFCMVMIVASCSKKKNHVQVINPIIEERINGPANIRDTINGDVIFSLDDSLSVSCTQMQNGWHVVGIMMDIPKDEYDNLDTIRKGRKILMNGEVVGEIKKDFPMMSASDFGGSYATHLIGYTRPNNIYKQTIIENNLLSYLDKTGDSRTVEDMQAFIDNFNLDKQENTFERYETYSNYENWIEDPSPMFRIELVFYKGELIAILHSRPIKIKHTITQKLERGFEISFFKETDKELQNDYISKFNAFINSVD